MLEYLKKQLRIIEYETIVAELIAEGHPKNEIRSFEEWEELRNHKCTFDLKRVDNEHSSMYICDNPLCKTLIPKEYHGT